MALHGAAGLSKDTGKAVRQQLDRMLASPTFQQVDRLKRFLNFIVTETIAGRGDQLKEYVVGVQVFDKETSFDPRTDPIVRVQARRLRARLARYYRSEGQTDETIIDLPKGGYVPVFRRREGRRHGSPVHQRGPGQRQLRRGHAVQRPQPGRRPRLRLQRSAPGDHPRTGQGGCAPRGRLGCRRPDAGREQRGGGGHAGGGHDRHRKRPELGGAPSRDGSARRRRHRPVLLVGIDRRQRARPLRPAAAGGRDGDGPAAPGAPGRRPRPPRRAGRRRTWPRTTCTCRAVTTSTSAPKKGC